MSTPPHTDRRKIIKGAVRLVFLAPLVVTYSGRKAQAQAGSNLSCYPLGHACTGADAEPCCAGLSCATGDFVPTCK